MAAEKSYVQLMHDLQMTSHEILSIRNQLKKIHEESWIESVRISQGISGDIYFKLQLAHAQQKTICLNSSRIME